MSFRLKTIAGIAGIEAVFLVALLWTSLQFLEQSNEAQISKRAHVTAQLFATSASSALVTTDVAALDGLVHEVLLNNGVRFARVIDVRGRILSQGGDAADLARPFHQTRGFDDVKNDTFCEEQPVLIGGTPYGSVQVGLSTRSVHEVMAAAQRKILSIAGTEISLAALFSFLLGSFLTRQLNALRNGVRRIAEGELGYELPVSGNDELAETLRGFNEMSNNLRTAELERRQQEERIKALNIALEQRVKERTEALATANRDLAHLALHDPLTGLPNRLVLQQRLDSAVHEFHDRGRPFALTILDLNGFKDVNDGFGHQAGDDLLKSVATRLVRAVRESDTIARMGGDEFALLFPGVGDVDVAKRIVNKLIAAMADPHVVNGQAMVVRGSFGIALCPSDADDAPLLLSRADIAMYEAKRSGQTISVFDPSHADGGGMDGPALAHELQLALQRDELVLHYQPKIATVSGAVIGAEALVRWQHPERGLLYPDAFIAIAERSHLIRSLTKTVVKKAIAQAKSWEIEGNPLQVAVNVSVIDLQDNEFPDFVARALKEADLAPGMLELEITETAVLRDPAHVQDVLARLSAIGVQLSIDDFGTGYSSMVHLKHLRVGKLKIDRSFVTDAAVNSSDRAIIRSVVTLAHGLGLEVIAEGVEDYETRVLLAAAGSDCFQGYHVARPFAPDAFAKWLQTYRPVPIASGYAMVAASQR